MLEFLEHDPEKWEPGFPRDKRESVCAEIMLKKIRMEQRSLLEADLRRSPKRSRPRAVWLSAQKNRRLDRSRPPGAEDPVCWAQKRFLTRKTLQDRRSDHAEHDGADKGKSEIRGHNAQSVDERTKRHFETSQSHLVARHNASS
jgi:hypothetical protein